MLSEMKAKTAQLITNITRASTAKQQGVKKPLVQTFIQQYYARVPYSDLSARQALDLQGAALSHMQFGAKRKPGESSVRVYNPNYEKHTWQSTHSVLEIVTDDVPFLIDSVSLAMDQLGITTHLTVHPILRVSRDATGRIKTIHERESEQGSNESFMQFHIDRQTDAEAHKKLEAEVLQVLEDVRQACAGWMQMRQFTLQAIEELQQKPGKIQTQDLGEAIEFCQWLESGHFTFLGCCDYEIQGTKNLTLRLVSGSELGLLKEPKRQEQLKNGLFIPVDADAYAHTADPVFVTKANLRATVHRPGYMDFIGIKRYDDKGKLLGMRCLFGLFTSAAYRLVTRDIPMLRNKMSRIIQASGLIQVSHEGKVLENILESYPRDELFQATESQLLNTAMGILELQERHRIRLFMRADDFGRYCSCLVYIPREKYSRELRLSIQEILSESLHASSVDFDTLFSSESVLARIYYTIHTTPGHSPKVTVTQIERQLIEAARSWEDKLNTALIEKDGEELAVKHFNRYCHAFPASYRDSFAAVTAAKDIESLETMGVSGLAMQMEANGVTGGVRFKLYSRDQNMALSDVIPVIENMGLRVEGEHPYQIKPKDSTPVWLHEFNLVHAQGLPINVAEVAELFKEAFARVWFNDAENDRFNYLILAAGINWRATVMLRAYCKYLLQIGVPFSQDYMIESLTSNAPIATLLCELFDARFNPEIKKAADKQEKIINDIEQALENVAILDQDRILRAYLNVIQSTIRSNYYQTNAEQQPKAYVSFKFDPSNITNLPLPRPKFEIFVYSPRVEGVHLRGGKVARGGLRWSDRREDFRTEVLGLVKAQMVKNAVIVPVGSKGGFVCKRLPEGDRETVMAEVIDCYKTFIRGMLDLTDNLIASKVIPPQQLVRHDEDDPYLVVAADKGTATFSDIANSVSEEYGFWLGDAFASGGSVGYDHKKMGITARGAWESVKRHFRGLGKDIQHKEFTVAGIGDMSGDVFGNGMLLSKHILLVAAFNHQHIFLDPSPDAAKTFAERKRLFELPRSSWTDYDTKLISKGGGIYPRSAKSISIGPEIKRLLNINDTKLTPTELIRAILMAKVELLWNGGIGTYVKASYETHEQASDRSNDVLRVDGKELRCKVVGEGGNLGLTQNARVEYSRNGGSIYTDAIDNSAGVDCSDHEVNIKILLNLQVVDKKMTVKQRNKLLAEMTDDVAELVLFDNYGQTEAISFAASQAAADLNEQARFIRLLEQDGALNRKLEFLPSDEAIAELAAKNEGLSNPELSVLLAYSKMRLYDALLDSDVPEDQYLSQELQRYFPERLTSKYTDVMQRHPLKREIIATHITNSLVTRMGPTFVMRVQDQTGADVTEIARAYAAARNILEIRDAWQDIEALDNKVSTKTQQEMLFVLRGLLERSILWLLRNRTAPLNVGAEVKYFQQGVRDLIAAMPEPLDQQSSESCTRLSEQFIEAKVPKVLAARIAGMIPLSSALDIVEVSKTCKRPIALVAGVHFELGTRLELQWLRHQISSLNVANNWHHLAKSGLRHDLHQQQHNLAVLALTSSGRTLQSKDVVDAWAEANAEVLQRFRQLMTDLKAFGIPDFAMLTVAANEVRNLQHSLHS